MILDILIPTYNRRDYVIKNIDFLVAFITRLKIADKVNIKVSDNNSTDNTFESLQNLDFRDCKVIITKQPQNVGLEQNAISLLKHSSSNFIMYRGDDDFITCEYLEEVMKLINADDHISWIIPGIVARHANGVEALARSGKAKNYVKGGFCSILKYSYMAHQLSGVVYKRDELYEKYLKNSHLRNIYPFIFFLSSSMNDGPGAVLFNNRVIVSEGNKKDWNYDGSGLLHEIFQNFEILFRGRNMKYRLACLAVIAKQPWRLGFGKGLLAIIRSYNSFLRDERSDLIHCLLVFFCMPLWVALRFINAIVLKLNQRRTVL